MDDALEKVVLYPPSRVFEACRNADFDLLQEALTTRNKSRREEALHDVRSFVDHRTGLTDIKAKLLRGLFPTAQSSSRRPGEQPMSRDIESQH